MKPWWRSIFDAFVEVGSDLAVPVIAIGVAYYKGDLTNAGILWIVGFHAYLELRTHRRNVRGELRRRERRFDRLAARVAKLERKGKTDDRRTDDMG